MPSYFARTGYPSMKTILAVTALLCAGAANAVTITGYDVDNTAGSGFGGWDHSYTGTITPDGGYFDYAGGTGSMADGDVPTTEHNDHLLDLSAGPSVTVYLSSATLLSTIDILSAYGFTNVIPGNLSSVTVSFGSLSATYSTTGFGPIGASGNPFNDRITLTGLLASTATSQFTLSNFQVNVFDGYTAIGEISVNGAAAGVPEASTWAMLIAGFGMVGATMRRRKAVAI